MAFFAIVFLVPLVVAIAAFIFFDGITLKELLVIAGAQLVVAGSSAGITSCAATHDVETWNGRVTSKEQKWVSCEHSYQCNCITTTTGSGNNQTTTTTCQTCYDHSNDWDWNVYTSNGEVITINRVDRQGVWQPARWASVAMGEPTSVSHNYTNYIKASPGTLFRHQGLKEKYASSLPQYPDSIYDYYRLNRLVQVGGVSVPNAREWNDELSKINADLGSARQANIIVVLTSGKPDDWFYALEESWVGGKKNDITLVISVDQNMKPQWSQVMAWSSNQAFQVNLRDDINDEPVINQSVVTSIIKKHVATEFKRKPMKDFEYLKSSITPSGTAWTISLIIGFLTAIGLVWFFQVNDVFDEERGRSYEYEYGYHGNKKKRRSNKKFSFSNSFTKFLDSF